MGGAGRWRPAALLLLLALLLRASLGTNVAEAAPFELLHAPMQYACVGQAKSGTSTLWWNLVQNPAIRTMGNTKETHYWHTESGEARCDASVPGYNELAAQARIKWNSTDLIVGDWSTTYLSCPCCAAVLRAVNPALRVIVMLRDPIKRALSRFVEQQRNAEFIMHRKVAGQSFAAYTEKAVDEMEACLRDAKDSSATRTGSAGSAGEGAAAAGPPAGMGLARWRELQCYHNNSIVGWSVYPPFLENYMAHFPPSQLLVLYTEDMALRPLQTIKRAERFLQAPPYEYDPSVVTSVFNSHECYHWQCGRNKTDVRPLPEEGTLGHAVMRLVDFYRPHMQQLIGWADQGRIGRVPASWRSTYR